MERSSFLYVSLIQIMKKKSNFPSLDFTPFKPTIYGGGPQTPSPTHLQYKNYHVICVCRERGL